MKICEACGTLNLQGPPLRLSCKSCGAKLGTGGTVKPPVGKKLRHEGDEAGVLTLPKRRAE